MKFPTVQPFPLHLIARLQPDGGGHAEDTVKKKGTA
jgi:hypothetical protein